MKFEKIWKELTWLEIGAMATMVAYLLYLKNSTALVLNYNNVTGTALYAVNSYVPKSTISNSQIFFGIALFAIIIFLLLGKRLRDLGRATVKEALDDLSKQIKELKEITLADGTTVVIQEGFKIEPTNQFRTIYKTIGQERKAWRYSFLVLVNDTINDVEHYFRAWYHPWDRYWDGFFETKTSLRESDRCPRCGLEADEKILIGEDLARFNALRKSLNPQGRI